MCGPMPLPCALMVARMPRSRVMPPLVVASTRLTSTASNLSSAWGWYEPPCSSPIATGVEMPSRISRTICASPGGTMSSNQPMPSPSSCLPKSMASAAVLCRKLASMPSHASG